VREDLAVVVGDGVSAGEVIAVVRQAAGPELESVELFDVYRAGSRSVPGGSRSRSTSSSAPATALSPTPRSAHSARRSSRALAEQLGGEPRA
jgi:phenylalanyl-tRNA synthetase beta chain